MHADDEINRNRITKMIQFSPHFDDVIFRINVTSVFKYIYIVNI